MGFMDDMKKLFWAKKAVAKSAAKKGAEELKEAADEGYDVVKGFADEVADKAEKSLEDVKKYMASKKESTWDPPEDDDYVPSDHTDQPLEDETVDPISESMKKASSKEKAGEALDKAKKVGEEVLDKAVEMSDQVWIKAEEGAKKVAEEGAKFGEKAKEMAKDVGDKISDKLDEMLEKAEELDKTIEEEKQAMDANQDGFADTPTHEKLRQQGSLLDDKDDFWAKADRFSKGDYSMGKPSVVGRDDSVEKDSGGNIKGFDDLDGDGDSLMDDAIIVPAEEEEVKKPAAPEDTALTDDEDSINLLPPSDDESE